ncbi:MAG: pentapeptide repeat-containing protein [Thermosynechococcaceae cyanobacterium MS004]|nr:pentapeptide repeat-containing protein [Thermosynechococcaceae cyanobacterium MS004]
MVPVSHKNIGLDQEAAAGMTSLLQQGGAVLLGFMAMLILTGGAPSGLAVGLTVGLSGIFVTWKEQHRLTCKKRFSKQDQSFSISQAEKRLSTDILALPSNFTEDGIQEWLEQLKDKGVSRNKRAILRRKLTDFSPEANAMKNLKLIIAAFTMLSSDHFGTLASIAGLDPLRDFAKSNLFRADLSGANLYGADLSGANLYEADLSGANLYEADLSGADLSGADLSGAHLSGANLTRATLNEANLDRAILSEANLTRATLNKANLGGTILRGTDLRDADLTEANLRGAIVAKARFLFLGRGISSELKRDLQSRGAIFEDAPGDRGKVLSPH